MTAILLAVAGCGSGTGLRATQRPAHGRLRIFQRTVAPSQDGEVHLCVFAEGATSAVVSGRFPVRGLELDLPSGAYAVTTWFRPYTEDMQLGPVTARCEGVVVVPEDATAAFVRVQDDETCHFEPGEAAWNVSLHAGEMMASPWSIALAHDGEAGPFLELGMPETIAAVFLDVEPDASGRFRKLWVVGSLRWKDGDTIEACTIDSRPCVYFYDWGWCRGPVTPAELERSAPIQLFVNRNDGSRRRSYGCLIMD